MKKVIIVVPIYRPLTDTERQSLEQLLRVLGHYPIDLLHPERLPVGDIMAQYGQGKQLTETVLPDSNFRSVQSYSDLCLTESFYDLYGSYEYMLIYQLDAWIFSDQLQAWVDRGYDYVGAPWVPTEYYYKKFVGMLHQRLRKCFPVDIYHIPHCMKYFAVGNGGFSLRRISTMKAIMHDDRDIISQLNGRYYEDWYISQVATRTHQLNIPDWRTALQFSYEQALSHCYELNHKELPFGCHYWSNPKNYKRFWHRFIHT